MEMDGKEKLRRSEGFDGDFAPCFFLTTISSVAITRQASTELFRVFEFLLALTVSYFQARIPSTLLASKLGPVDSILFFPRPRLGYSLCITETWRR